jgi:hypothetical protein
MYPDCMKPLVREQAPLLLEQLPEDATREDLQYKNNVRQAVEAGEAKIRASNFFTFEQARQRFGLHTKV